MLIDVHAHFFPEHSARADWREYNASRLRAGERIGITVHLNSVLGTFGRTSPTYFPSRTDVCVNPNYPEHALAEIENARAAGAVGIKLAASRRATDPLLDPICAAAARHGLPVLHHIWQHR